MDAGPVDAALADLGPISPELALVDPDLAARARPLLPDLFEPPARRPPAVAAVAAEPGVDATEAPAPRRRLWRALALAVLTFTAGAVAGDLLANRHVQAGATLESPVAAASAPAVEVLQSPRAARAAANRAVTTVTPLAARTVAPTTRTSVRRPALRPRVTAHAAVPARSRRARRPQVTWASNVLGVTATVTRRGVALVWQRPSDSVGVVVLRDRGGRSRVVYRGRATGYRDGSLQACTGYRYTIVSYDGSGHRSTGVPTSIVTRCA